MRFFHVPNISRREARDSVCRSQIQILTEKYILRIPLIRLISQIIGRKQINGRIRKFGLKFKCESATKENRI